MEKYRPVKRRTILRQWPLLTRACTYTLGSAHNNGFNIRPQTVGAVRIEKSTSGSSFDILIDSLNICSKIQFKIGKGILP